MRHAPTLQGEGGGDNGNAASPAPRNPASPTSTASWSAMPRTIACARASASCCASGRSVASVDVRGGAPGTRETDLLDPSCRVDASRRDLFSRAARPYGLSSTDGVMRWLREHGRGVPIADVVVPIVPTAILFDLLNGGDKQWDWPPYRELGLCRDRQGHPRLRLGNAGAGLGAKAATSRAGWAALRRSIRRRASRSARWWP